MIGFSISSCIGLMDGVEEMLIPFGCSAEQVCPSRILLQHRPSRLTGGPVARL